MYACVVMIELHFFGVARKFKCYRGGYSRVVFQERLALKEDANL